MGDISVLIVEDDSAVRTSYVNYLRRKGFTVAEAHDRGSAIEAIHNRTFHVALVDIMLAGEDVTNRDGVAIIEQLNALGEGTLAVAVSTQDDTQLAADLVQKYKAYRYLSKTTVRRGRFEPLVEIVERAYADLELHPFGLDSVQRKNRSALAYLAGGGQALVLAFNRWLSVLGRNASPNTLENLIEVFFSRWAPILPLKGEEEYLRTDENNQLLHGTFWSKAEAKAVDLIICSADGVDRIVQGGINEAWRVDTELTPGGKRYSKGRLVGMGFDHASGCRSEFLERLQPRSIERK